MAFRAIGSALFRPSNSRVIKQIPFQGSQFLYRHNGVPMIIRAFAAEAGFLDKKEVTERVLEVVRKFEKVR